MMLEMAWICRMADQAARNSAIAKVLRQDARVIAVQDGGTADVHATAILQNQSSFALPHSSNVQARQATVFAILEHQDILCLQSRTVVVIADCDRSCSNPPRYAMTARLTGCVRSPSRKYCQPALCRGSCSDGYLWRHR